VLAEGSGEFHSAVHTQTMIEVDHKPREAHNVPWSPQGGAVTRRREDLACAGVGLASLDSGDDGGGRVVSAEIARVIARRVHGGQVTRFGEPMIEHVERVACALPSETRALAYLHDVLEAPGAGDEELRALGLSDDERSVLALLTRRPEEPYRGYVMGIACAPGTVGALARVIKLADLEDHLRHRQGAAGAPCYAWAHEKITAYQRAYGEA
jgi:hypothetical protein